MKPPRPVIHQHGDDLFVAQDLLRLVRVQVAQTFPAVDDFLLVDELGRLTGLVTLKDFVKREAYPAATKDERGRLRVGAAARAAALVQSRPAGRAARVASRNAGRISS